MDTWTVISAHNLLVKKRIYLSFMKNDCYIKASNNTKRRENKDILDWRICIDKLFIVLVWLIVAKTLTAKNSWAEKRIFVSALFRRSAFPHRIINYSTISSYVSCVINRGLIHRQCAIVVSGILNRWKDFNNLSNKISLYSMISHRIGQEHIKQNILILCLY